MTATAAAPRDPGAPVEIVSVGAGPAAAMVLERIVANHARDTPELPLRIRLVDPYPPGGGRIWRRDQSPLLKLNSMLRDVAFFTDPSCAFEGPVAPGLSLAEWVRAVRAGSVPAPEWADARLRREIAEIADDGFPTRRLNNAYLEWAFAETLRRAAPAVRVSWEEDRVVAVEDPAHSVASGARPGPAPGPEQHLVRLASGGALAADIVVYAVGHTGAEPSADAAQQAAFAERHGLRYVAPAFTADVDLADVPAGADVIVRGMGLAAIDLGVLLAEGRGGLFVPRADGSLRYAPSGREPILHFGSRRGVPYRSKITSQVVGDPVELAYLGAGFQAETAVRTEPLDFERDAWPLVAAELVTGYYRELCTGHPDRVRSSWTAFAPRLREALAEPDPAVLARLIAEQVPDPQDRFDLPAFDRPLAAAPAGSDPVGSDPAGSDPAGSDPAAPDRAGPVHERVLAHIAEDLRLRTSPEHSATQALFLTGLYAFLALAEIPPERWNARSRTRALPRRWFSFFSYLASGPPGHRLHELLALAEAGVVRFLGGDLVLERDERAGLFRATGSAVTGTSAAVAVTLPTATASVSARILIDAWLPEARAAESDNPLLRQLVASGRARELAVADPERGTIATTRQIEAERDGSLPGAPRQFAVGPFVAGLTGGAFTRPGINSLPFRTHDRCARAILAAAAELVAHRDSARVAAAGGAAPVPGAVDPVRPPERPPERGRVHR